MKKRRSWRKERFYRIVLISKGWWVFKDREGSLRVDFIFIFSGFRFFRRKRRRRKMISNILILRKRNILRRFGLYRWSICNNSFRKVRRVLNLRTFCMMGKWVIRWFRKFCRSIICKNSEDRFSCSKVIRGRGEGGWLEMWRKV